MYKNKTKMRNKNRNRNNIESISGKTIGLSILFSVLGVVFVIVGWRYIKNKSGDSENPEESKNNSFTKILFPSSTAKDDNDDVTESIDEIKEKVPVGIEAEAEKFVWASKKAEDRVKEYNTKKEKTNFKTFLELKEKNLTLI